MGFTSREEQGFTTREEQGFTTRGEGLKLGVGDFVFYSVLVGRAALFDATAMVACFVGILAGLTMTLFSLAVLQQALPALPLSITLGAIFFVMSTHALLPFLEPLLACALLV